MLTPLCVFFLVLDVHYQPTATEGEAPSTTKPLQVAKSIATLASNSLRSGPGHAGSFEQVAGWTPATMRYSV